MVDERGTTQDRGLHAFIKSFTAPVPATSEHHRTTKELFPILTQLTSQRDFESEPSYLVVESEWNRIPKNSRPMLLGTRMLQFDALADYLQALHHKRLFASCILAIGFLGGFELFAHVFEDQPYVLVGALLCLAAAFTVVIWMKSLTIQMAYLSARAIAEMLRFLFFMEGSGVTVRARDCVPRRYQPIMSRVLLVVEAIEADGEGLEGHSMSPEDVKQAWFVGQDKYFRKAADREHKAAMRWEAASSVGFGLGILALIVLAAASFSQAPHSDFTKALKVVGPSLLGLAAICQFYLERRGFKSNSERYRHSVHIYDPIPGADWEATVRDVGTQALHEVVDWYVASVEREISVPRG